MSITLNININRTLEELGTDITKLKPNSCKKVYRICEICKSEDLKEFRAVSIFHQTKCLNCSNKLNAANNREKISASNKKYFETHAHPRTGIKHTKETIEKIKKNRKPPVITQEFREKMSRIMKGKTLGRKHSIETILKLKEIQKKNAKKGKDCNFYGKTFFAKSIDYVKKNGSIVKLKSTWELKFAQYLDEQNIEWEYEKKSFPITYEYNGEVKNGTYIPDFFLENGEVVEVKGYWRKDAQIKFEMFKLKHPDLKVTLLQKEQLKNLGIKL